MCWSVCFEVCVPLQDRTSPEREELLRGMLDEMVVWGKRRTIWDGSQGGKWKYIKDRGRQV